MNLLSKSFGKDVGLAEVFAFDEIPDSVWPLRPGLSELYSVVPCLVEKLPEKEYRVRFPGSEGLRLHQQVLSHFAPWYFLSGQLRGGYYEKGSCVSRHNIPV